MKILRQIKLHQIIPSKDKKIIKIIDFFDDFFKKVVVKDNVEYNSKFYLNDFYELDECIDTTKCTCEVKILNVNILRSDILPSYFKMYI